MGGSISRVCINENCKAETQPLHLACPRHTCIWPKCRDPKFASGQYGNYCVGHGWT